LLLSSIFLRSKFLEKHGCLISFDPNHTTSACKIPIGFSKTSRDKILSLKHKAPHSSSSSSSSPSSFRGSTRSVIFVLAKFTHLEIEKKKGGGGGGVGGGKDCEQYFFFVLANFRTLAI
jgi:hypothetical protein